MNLKTSIVGLFLIFLTAISLTAQDEENLVKADEAFNNLAYQKALDLYTDLAQQGDYLFYVTNKIATIYRLLGDTQNAEKWYAKVVSFSDVDFENLYYYAQMLKSNGKFEESNEWMEKYYEYESKDSRAVSYAVQKNYLNNIMDKQDHYEIIKVTINSQYGDFSPVFMKADKLAFVSSRPVKRIIKLKSSYDESYPFDVYSADIVNLGQLVNVHSFSSRINSALNDGPVAFAKSGTEMFITRNFRNSLNSPDEISNLKISVSHLDAEGRWTIPEDLPFNSEDFSNLHPTVTEDGKDLYFASDRPGGFGGMDLYYCTIRNGFWSKPQNLGPQINTEGNEVFPSIASDGSLMFSSDGHVGLGGLDIFVAFSAPDGFFKPYNAGYPLNSPKDDFGVTLDKNGKSGYFSSNRKGGLGEDDIYAFKILKPLEIIEIKGVVVDKTSERTIGQAIVNIYDHGRKTAEFVTSSNGRFEFLLDKKEEYRLEVRRRFFDPYAVTLNTDTVPHTGALNVEVLLEEESY